MTYFNPLSGCSPVTNETVISLMEMAYRTARNGLFCVAELAHARPTWESWIVVAAKRRAIITMYLSSSVYNADRLLLDFVAREIKDMYAPGDKALWNANDRETGVGRMSGVCWSGKMECWRFRNCGSQRKRDQPSEGDE